MSKLVRATDPTTGREFTTSEAYAKRKGLTTNTHPATDRFGRIVRDKARLNLSGGATRAELEQAARDAGLDEQTITTARTKADLTAAIETAANQTQEA